MGLRSLVSTVALSAAVSVASACESAQLNVESWTGIGVDEVRSVYEGFSPVVRSSLGEFNVFVAPGPITDLRNYAHLRGEAAPGYARTWDEVAAMYDPNNDWAFVSVENARDYFRGFTALEEEAWHAIDDAYGFSGRARFRRVAEPFVRWYDEHNYGRIDEDRMYREIFAENADRMNDSDSRPFRSAYPDYVDYMHEHVFSTLEFIDRTCNALKAGLEPY